MGSHRFMAITRILSFAFSGIDPIPVEIQVQITSGLPAFIIVGLADKTVGESRERIRAALISMGISLPPKRILVNLAPADIVKEGTHYDLPIALAILTALEIFPEEETHHYAAVGELSLDGYIGNVNGVISAAIGASRVHRGLICPYNQGQEALLGGDISIIPAPDLISLLNHFTGKQVLPVPKLSSPTISKNNLDLIDVKGMETPKRALEIAAAGGHSLLMIGPPGSGKSMLASRLPGLLPDLTPIQSLDVTRIYSSAGLLSEGRPIIRPPFRDPHHSASPVALTGGGAKAKPGEISLAHHGVLFLDELPEFSRQALESLRQPLETGQITVARAMAHICYPARFQLIAAMNPCRCGYLGDTARECHRIPRCAEEYTRKISGPLMDRIDMVVTVTPIPPSQLIKIASGEQSHIVAQRVKIAREKQIKRQSKLNSETNPDHFCLATEAIKIVEQAATRIRLSARGLTRLLSVSRTIADLAESHEIQIEHVTEALSYRHRQKENS